MRRGMRWFEIGADVLQTFARHEDPVVVEPHPESAALVRRFVLVLVVVLVLEFWGAE